MSVAARVLRLVLLASCLALLPAPGGAAQPDNPGADPWGFEEEAAEPLSEIIAGQAADIAGFVAFAALALWSFFRKSDRLKVVTLVAAVVYLGFYKSQLISIVNVFAALTANLPVVTYSLGWYTFAVFAVASTVVWGRLYCGRVCAFGALTQLMDRVVPARLRVEVPGALERRAGYVKYVLLAAVVAYYLVTRDISVYRYVEPFWMFTLQETPAMWIGLGVLLVATIFVRNLYCRFLCPVGAALGVIAQVTTAFRIKRWSECSTCRICEKACEWGAIRGPKIIRSECVRCDDCERLYDDHQKCPHWLIIARRTGVIALRAVQTAAPARTPLPTSDPAPRP